MWILYLKIKKRNSSHVHSIKVRKLAHSSGAKDLKKRRIDRFRCKTRVQVSYESHFDTSLVWSPVWRYSLRKWQEITSYQVSIGKVAKESRERSRYDLARLEPARHVTRALISSDGRDTSLSTDFSTNSLLDYSLKIVVKE